MMRYLSAFSWAGDSGGGRTGRGGGDAGCGRAQRPGHAHGDLLEWVQQVVVQVEAGVNGRQIKQGG